MRATRDASPSRQPMREAVYIGPPHHGVPRLLFFSFRPRSRLQQPLPASHSTHCEEELRVGDWTLLRTDLLTGSVFLHLQVESNLPLHTSPTSPPRSAPLPRRRRPYYQQRRPIPLFGLVNILLAQYILHPLPAQRDTAPCNYPAN